MNLIDGSARLHWVNMMVLRSREREAVITGPWKLGPTRQSCYYSSMPYPQLGAACTQFLLSKLSVWCNGKGSASMKESVGSVTEDTAIIYSSTRYLQEANGSQTIKGIRLCWQIAGNMLAQQTTWKNTALYEIHVGTLEENAFRKIVGGSNVQRSWMHNNDVVLWLHCCLQFRWAKASSKVSGSYPFSEPSRPC